jgi:hypothetical protein
MKRDDGIDSMPIPFRSCGALINGPDFLSTSDPTRRMPFPFLIQKRVLLPALILSLLTALAVHVADSWWSQWNGGTLPKLVPGPWGDLQTWDVRLEQPAEYSGFESVTSDGPYWNFAAMSPESVRASLLSAGISVGDADRLLKDCRVQSLNGLVIKPDLPTLLAMRPEVRSVLYRTLATIPGNRFQSIPYYIPGDDPLSLFGDHSRLAKRVLPAMKKLCYRRNGFTYFSDPEAVLSLLSSAAERKEFLKNLTSQQVVFLRLLVRPDCDIDKPLNYWCLSMHGVRLKDLRPLFESQLGLPGGGSVSIDYLLPPLAREKLFTSPLPPATGQERLPDCHWTALNFFNAAPDPRMGDNDFAARFISEHYYQVAVPCVGGDLVLLLDDHNRVIHSSVYIAGDVVFTKNGINYAQPWVLMHERDLIGTFAGLDPVKVAYFRKKGI